MALPISQSPLCYSPAQGALVYSRPGTELPPAPSAAPSRLAAGGICAGARARGEPPFPRRVHVAARAPPTPLLSSSHPNRCARRGRGGGGERAHLRCALGPSRRAVEGGRFRGTLRASSPVLRESPGVCVPGGGLPGGCGARVEFVRTSEDLAPPSPTLPPGGAFLTWGRGRTAAPSPVTLTAALAAA